MNGRRSVRRTKCAYHVWGLPFVVGLCLLLFVMLPSSAWGQNPTPEPPKSQPTPAATPTPALVIPAPETLAFFRQVRDYPLLVALLENRGIAFAYAAALAMFLAAAGLMAMPAHLWLFLVGAVPRPHGPRREALVDEEALASLAVAPASLASNPATGPAQALADPATVAQSPENAPSPAAVAQAPPAPQPQQAPQPANGPPGPAAQQAAAGQTQAPAPPSTAESPSPETAAQPNAAQAPSQAAQGDGANQQAAAATPPPTQAPASQQPADGAPDTTKTRSPQSPDRDPNAQGTTPTEQPQGEQTAQELLANVEQENQQAPAGDVKDILASAFEEEEELDPQLALLASRLEDVEARSLARLAQEVLRLLRPLSNNKPLP